MSDIYFWQQSLWQRFLTAKQQQKLAHAIVLSGVDGLGKNAFSLHMAKATLCLTPNTDGSYCDHCHSCQVFDAGNHPDHHLIEPVEQGKQIKIEQIRDLKEKQQLTPTISRWKTVIISPAYNMNVNANNSLLKLLEEPEANTLIVLITSKPEVMPITVKSRCQTFHFTPPDLETSIRWLQDSYPGFKRDTSTEQFFALSKGAPLAVINMMENGSAEHVEQINNDIELLFKQRVNPIEFAANWLNYDLTTLMQQLYQRCYQRVTNQYKNDQRLLNNKQQSHQWQIVDCIVETTKLISSQNNLNKQLLLERFLVELNNIIHPEVR